MTRSAALLFVALAVLFITTCGNPTLSAADVRARLPAFNAVVDPLGDVRADLEILLDDGSPAVASVLLSPTEQAIQGTSVIDVESPIPMDCSNGGCELNFNIPPGNYRFTLFLYAADRCGRESLMGAFRPTMEGAYPLGNTGAQELIELSRARYDFDDDGDDIINVLELQTCGRTDMDERDQTPGDCAFADDPCCGISNDSIAEPELLAWGSPLIGKSASLAGGTWLLSDNTLSDPIEPFHLDATEVTWGQFARCVAAGVCLRGDLAHPARQAVLVAPRSMPATGLSPYEAARYCAWAQKRLPTDEEWDYAAAARDHDDGHRAPYPFEARPDATPPTSGPVVLPEDISDLSFDCREGQGPIAFNHFSAVPGASCPLGPVSVGSYASSLLFRGTGAPLADLAGNVWEWTLERKARVDVEGAPSEESFLEAAGDIFMRGGNYRSAALSVSNQFNRIQVQTDRDTTNIERLTVLDNGRVADVVGFRCAWDDDDAIYQDGIGARSSPICPALP